MYFGPYPSLHLNISNKILEATLSLTLTQCNFFKTGVIWSNFLVPVINLAVMLIRDWTLHSCFSGNPANNVLQ